jgi:hypothetical protein
MEMAFMDKKKSQAHNFAFEALPTLFHAQTDDFMKYLERDGINFIKFWWDNVGSQLPPEMQSTFDCVEFKIIPINEKKKLSIITLPPPIDDCEMYYLGFISQPEKRFAWVRLPLQRAIGLARRSRLDFPRGTEIGDLTPRGLFVSLGAGPEPDLDAFTSIMLKYAKPEGQA